MQIKKIVAILAVLMSVMVAGPGFAQDPAPDLEVLEVDASAFPAIQVDALVRQGGRFVPGLDAGAFTIDDAASIDRVSTTQEAPITQVLIIDPGYAPDLQIIRNTALALFNDRFVRPDDRMILYVARSSTQSDRYEFTDLEAARQELLSLQAANAPLNAGQTLNTAIEELRSSTDMPVQAVYIGSFLFARPGVYDAADAFRQAGIGLQVVQASSRNNPTETTAFGGIAERSGGLFVDNSNGLLTDTSTEPVRPLGSLLTLYNSMQEARTAYRISYTASSDRYDVRRNVNLRVRVGEAQSDTVAYNYEPVYQAPSVQIVAPDSFDIIRTSDPSQGFDLQESRIVAEVSYPDGVRRPIQAVSLRVVDSNSGAELSGGGGLSPETLPDDQVAFAWNLRGYLDEGTIPVRLEIELRDALGLTASTSINGSVTVRIIQPTPLPTETPIPSLAPVETNADPGASTTEAGVSALATQAPAFSTDAPPSDNTPQIVPTEALVGPVTGPDSTDPTPVVPVDPTGPDDSAAQSPADGSDINAIINQLTQPENMPIVVIVATVVLLAVLLLLFFIIRSRRSTPSKGSGKSGAKGGKPQPNKGSDLPGGATMISDFSEVRRAVAAEAAKQEKPKQIPDQGTAIFEAGTALFAVPDAPQVKNEVTRTRAILTVVSGLDGASPVIAIDRGVFIIGRTLSSGCHYAINNKFVSSPHITIENRDDRFFITDDNSKNGTFVDDAPLQSGRPYPLNDGARIVLGRAIHIEFHVMGAVRSPGVKSNDIDAALITGAADFLPKPAPAPEVSPPPAPKTGGSDYVTYIEEQKDTAYQTDDPAPPPAAPPAPRDADATMIDSPALRLPVEPPVVPPVQPPAAPPVQQPPPPPAPRDADATMLDSPALRPPSQPAADFEIPKTEPGNWDVDTNLDDDDLSPSRRGRPVQSVYDEDESSRIDDDWADET